MNSLPSTLSVCKVELENEVFMNEGRFMRFENRLPSVFCEEFCRLACSLVDCDRLLALVIGLILYW